VDIDKSRIEKRIETKYLDEYYENIDEALKRLDKALKNKEVVSIGLLGNAADVYRELVKRNIKPDFVTDQTSAHDPLNGYIPNNMSYEAALKLREENPKKYESEAYRTMGEQVQSMLDFSKKWAFQHSTMEII